MVMPLRVLLANSSESTQLRRATIVEEKLDVDAGVFPFGAEESRVLAKTLRDDQVSLPFLVPEEKLRLRAVVDSVSVVQAQQRALDGPGSNYLLASKLYGFMKREKDQDAHLASEDVVWAFHSDSQDALVEMCIPENAVWDDLKALGVGYWVLNTVKLTQVATNVAKESYRRRKEPKDAMLWYLMLDQLGVLQMLYRVAFFFFFFL
jgi:hypothetical protein